MCKEKDKLGQTGRHAVLNDLKQEYINDLKTAPDTGRYFQKALSDFMFDAASGRAIRHLVDDGYTSAQIMEKLDYPAPYFKIQKAVTDYLYETGILLKELPVSPACLKPISLHTHSEEAVFSALARRIRQNGEENSYMSCPFCSRSDTADSPLDILSLLTKREQDYILGILWESKTVFHRLNRRMLEIGSQLAVHADISFYFFKSFETLKA